MDDVVVIGGGPAGATVAARLAQLGHRVTIVDRPPRHRSHRCETLAGATLDLLTMTGADRSVLDAGFPRLDVMTVEWDAPRAIRPMPPGSLLVDRDHFDALLLERAAVLGVRVLRPLAAGQRRRGGSGWEIELGDDSAPLEARFLVDATGRRSNLRRSSAGALLGVTGRWDVSLEGPAVVALDDGWVWGAPCPVRRDVGPSCEVTAFVDPRAWRSLGHSPAERYARLVEAARLVSPGARLLGRVTAREATSALAAEVGGADWLAVGDSALALDPLSSSGVQRAVQSGLTAAVVIHTALTSADDAATALGHHRRMLTGSAEHHAEWTGESYAAVAVVRPTPFWTSRARSAAPPAPEPGAQPVPPPSPPHATVVRRSPLLRFVEVSQLIGDRVRLAPALEHPGLDGAVAYVGGTPVVPLLAPLDDVSTIADLVDIWAAAMPASRASELAGWLVRRGVLEQVGGA
jgi:flavin-dependent dehydrogenase